VLATPVLVDVALMALRTSATPGTPGSPATLARPVASAADSLQFILMQQMQQQLFQMQQQMMTFQVPATPPDAASNKPGASRSIVFTPSLSASSSTPLQRYDSGDENLKMMERESEGEL